MLRRSRNLFEFSSESVCFVSKLISGTFPTYARVIPTASGNAVVVEREALRKAIARIQAIAAAGKTTPPIGLDWNDGSAELRLCVAGWPDLADDPIQAAEVSGAGHAAFSIQLLAEQIDELAGEFIRLDSGGPMNPLLVTDPADPDLLTLLMPRGWPLDGQQKTEAA